MADQPESSLRKEIKEKQKEISDYLSRLEPFGSRLTYAGIICGGLAVLLNGEMVRTLSQEGGSSISWLFPLAAAGLTTIATLAASVYKAQVESRLSQLQSCAAGMEGLAVLLDAQAVTEKAAAKEFQRYIEKCPAIPRRKKFAYDAVKGTIVEPGKDQIVQDKFVASGSVHNAGADARLWLTVEIDGKIWPKEGRVVPHDADGHWRHTVFEDGVAEKFGLSLWVANPEADKKLRIWLDECNRTRVFPELRPFPGMVRLDRVKGLRVRK